MFGVTPDLQIIYDKMEIGVFVCFLSYFLIDPTQFSVLSNTCQTQFMEEPVCLTV